MRNYTYLRRNSHAHRRVPHKCNSLPPIARDERPMRWATWVSMTANRIPCHVSTWQGMRVIAHSRRKEKRPAMRRLQAGVHELDERIGLQGRTADEAAVDVFLGDEQIDVAGIHGAAV